MGWCQAFEVEIQPGCDHLMVAHRRSCLCEHCGTQCLGRFPGCANVWARGPVPVEIRPPGAGRMAAGARDGPAATDGPRGSASGEWWISSRPPRLENGDDTELESDEIAPAPGGVPPSEIRKVPGRGASPHLVDLFETLRDEIEGLRDQVDRLEDRAETAEDLARTALEATRDAQLHIRRALQEQHGAIANDLARLRVQIAREAERDLGSGLQTDTVLAHVDARLEWLVNHLSDRLVALAKEVAVISRQVADAEARRPTGDRAPGGG